MTNAKRKDPRKLKGTIAGPGGPHDLGAVIVDTTNGIVLDQVDVSTIDREEQGKESIIALVLGGRIIRTQDRAEVLFMFGTDGAASIITELIALMGRATGINAEQLLTDVVERMTELREEGNLE